MARPVGEGQHCQTSGFTKYSTGSSRARDGNRSNHVVRENDGKESAKRGWEQEAMHCKEVDEGRKAMVIVSSAGALASQGWRKRGLRWSIVRERSVGRGG